jgi:hypothetical protein
MTNLPALNPVVIRTVAFRDQLERWVRARRSGVPILALPGVVGRLGACLSCGQPLDAGRVYRCGACVAAVERVLGVRPALGS